MHCATSCEQSTRCVLWVSEKKQLIVVLPKRSAPSKKPKKRASRATHGDYATAPAALPTMPQVLRRLNFIVVTRRSASLHSFNSLKFSGTSVKTVINCFDFVYLSLRPKKVFATHLSCGCLFLFWRAGVDNFTASCNSSAPRIIHGTYSLL